MLIDRRKALLFAVLLSPACQAPTDTQIQLADIVGRYDLITVRGGALPVVLPLDGPPRLILRGDTLWLRQDSSYVEHMAREVIGPAPLVLTGKFVLAGRTITLSQTGVGPIVGRFRDSTLALEGTSESPFT